jgi:hypothetical protein
LKRKVQKTEKEVVERTHSDGYSQLNALRFRAEILEEIIVEIKGNESQKGNKNQERHIEQNASQ